MFLHVPSPALLMDDAEVRRVIRLCLLPSPMSVAAVFGQDDDKFTEPFDGSAV